MNVNAVSSRLWRGFFMIILSRDVTIEQVGATGDVCCLCFKGR